MKAKIIETGEIFEAKYFEDLKRDLTVEEMKDTTTHLQIWKEKDIFLEPNSWDEEHKKNEWRYMFDNEIEIISEDSI